MRSAPPVAYGATAERPPWPALPAAVRAVIAGRLGGGPVRDVRMAGAGFTRGFAAVLTTAAGQRAFVKASNIDYLVDACRREAAVTAALPAGVPAARPRWTAEAGDWFVLCLDPVDGRVPRLPWVAGELSAALDAWAAAAGLLRSGSWPDLGGPDLPSFEPVAQAAFTVWGEVAGHRAPLPRVPRYALAHLDELAALEARFVAVAGAAPAVMHGDLRLDNVLLDGSGRAWLCDWNHACRGPAWFDTVSLLVTAHASGYHASDLFAAHPTAAGTPDGALPAGLAALAGACLVRAGWPSDASPGIRAHQQWTGETALDWLAAHLGWRR